MRETPVKVLELRSVRGTGGGPEKTILLGAAGADPARALVTVCYVRDVRDEVFHIDRRAAELGVPYVEIVEKHSFDPGVWGQLRALVQSRDIDVVHSHDYKTDLLAWLLARRTGVATLSTAHGWSGNSTRERYVYYPAQKWLLGRFPLVLAVSSAIRSELVRRGARADRVRLLLNGIDHVMYRRDAALVAAARARYGVAHGAVAIGAVGRLEPEKRFDVLIEAFADVARRRDNVLLLIAGVGSCREALRTQARRMALTDRVHLVGHVGDVVPFHHALDMFVQSSDTEGTPNVVLEAMALETPIVATDVGGTAEICRPGEDGIVVPPGDVAALADGIRLALDDRDGRAHRVRSARRRVETDLSFEHRLRALENIYAEIAGGVSA